MKYSDLLKKYIKESRLTLDEVSERIEGEGLTASKQYLSKLQNGKTPPASEKMNKALAKITGGDEEKLIFEAYMEKAPREVKNMYRNLLSQSNEDTKKDESKTIKHLVLNSYEAYETTRVNLSKKFDQKTKESFLEKTDTPSKLLNVMEELGIDIHQKIESDFDSTSFKYMIINDVLTSDRARKQIKGMTGVKAQLEKAKNIIRIPVLGSIQAGDPIFTFENLEKYIDYPKPDNYHEDDLFFLRVKGDSMINSRIQEGDLVLVKIQAEVENGEIAVVNVNSDEATLKKVKKLENGQTLLIPSNDKYEPILIENENARIVGKVIQVIFEP